MKSTHFSMKNIMKTISFHDEENFSGLLKFVNVYSLEENYSEEFEESEDSILGEDELLIQNNQKRENYLRQEPIEILLPKDIYKLQHDHEVKTNSSKSVNDMNSSKKRMNIESWNMMDVDNEDEQKIMISDKLIEPIEINNSDVEDKKNLEICWGEIKTNIDCSEYNPILRENFNSVINEFVKVTMDDCDSDNDFENELEYFQMSDIEKLMYKIRLQIRNNYLLEEGSSKLFENCVENNIADLYIHLDTRDSHFKLFIDALKDDLKEKLGLNTLKTQIGESISNNSINTQTSSDSNINGVLEPNNVREEESIREDSRQNTGKPLSKAQQERQRRQKMKKIDKQKRLELAILGMNPLDYDVNINNVKISNNFDKMNSIEKSIDDEDKQRTNESSYKNRIAALASSILMTNKPLEDRVFGMKFRNISLDKSSIFSTRHFLQLTPRIFNLKSNKELEKLIREAQNCANKGKNKAIWKPKNEWQNSLFKWLSFLYKYGDRGVSLYEQWTNSYRQYHERRITLNNNNSNEQTKNSMPPISTLHTPLAWSFYLVSGNLLPIDGIRFHKFDFRIGIYDAFISKSNQIYTYSPNWFNSLINSKTAKNELGFELFGPWLVTPINISGKNQHGNSSMPQLLHRYFQRQREFKDIPSSINSSICFVSPEDLSLVHQTPIALFEYLEQYPLLLNNLGMAARINRFVRCDDDSKSELIENIVSQSGPLGFVQIVQSEKLNNQLNSSVAFPKIFGVNYPLENNESIAILETGLFKAPIYHHPRRKQTEILEETNEERNSYVSDQDERNMFFTDYLLIRKQVQPGSNKYNFYLRPLSGDSLTCLYSVGQEEPLIEIPCIDSKNFSNLRRDQLRAIALRYAKENGKDTFDDVRKLCQKMFRSTFDQNTLQKILISCKETKDHSLNDSISNTGLINNSQTSGIINLISNSNNNSNTNNQLNSQNVFLKQLNEVELRQIINPESICALDSSVSGDLRLKQIGVRSLRHFSKIPIVVSELDQMEEIAKQYADNARKRTNELIQKNRQIENLDQTKDDYSSLLSLINEISTGLINSNGRRLTPVARYIEESLLLSPWNITQEYVQVMRNQNGQFSIAGIGDPSGGRGEGINFIRRGLIDSAIESRNQKTLSGKSEDLRKLSMDQLRQRLLQCGFDDVAIIPLPRWDRVALVRHFDATGSSNRNTGSSNLSQNNQALSLEEYQKAIVNVLLNQENALKPDDPLMTDDEDDSYNTDYKDFNIDVQIPNSEKNEEKTNEDLLSMKRSNLNKSLSFIETNTNEIKKNLEFEKEYKIKDSKIKHIEEDTLDYTLKKSDSESEIDEEIDLEETFISSLVKSKDTENEELSNSNTQNVRKQLNQSKLYDQLFRNTSNDSNKDEEDEKDLEEFRKMISKNNLVEKNLDLSCELIKNNNLNKDTSSKIDDFQDETSTEYIPRLAWIRVRRNMNTWQYEDEKVVYIYGEENIKYFLYWRRMRMQLKREERRQLNPTGVPGVLGRASRTCRRCGQVGHIASNPMCPYYEGNKSNTSTSRYQNTVFQSKKKNMLSRTLYSTNVGKLTAIEEENTIANLLGMGYSQTSNAEIKQLVSLDNVVQSVRVGKRGRPPSNQTHSGDIGVNNSINHPHPTPNISQYEENIDVSSMQFSRLSARQRRKMMDNDDKSSVVSFSSTALNINNSGSVINNNIGYSSLDTSSNINPGPNINSYSEALDEFCIELQRIINSTKTLHHYSHVFWNRVSERIAPNYYNLVKKPMWLQLMINKCKKREYRSRKDFQDDMDLIVENCKIYNGINHPLVSVATLLHSNVLQKIDEIQGIEKIEAFLALKS